MPHLYNRNVHKKVPVTAIPIGSGTLYARELDQEEFLQRLELTGVREHLQSLLRGKDLVCDCTQPESCHGIDLLRVANAGAVPQQHPRAKPLNQKTLDAFPDAIATLQDNIEYLGGVVLCAKDTTTQAAFKATMATKRDNLLRVKEWLDSQLAKRTHEE